MFKLIIGADLGSKNTRLALRGGVFNEPTLVSMAACEREARGVGIDAEFARFGRVAPIRNGCCVNVALLAAMLAELVKKHGGRRCSPRNAELYLSLPKTMPLHRLRAFEKAAEAAGFRGFHILSRSIMGMLGTGENLFSPQARFIVDIGAQTTIMSAIASGGIIFECAESIGGELMDRAIQNYFASAHRVMIGARAAELIKLNLDRLGFTVDGRSPEDGLPRSVNADAEQVREAALGACKTIVSFAKDTLRLLPPEACADLVETGITLIGGGAKMQGLKALFEAELGLSARVAENADTAVADGIRRYLFLEKGSADTRLCEYARAAELEGAPLYEEENPLLGGKSFKI